MLIIWDGTKGRHKDGSPKGWRTLDLHRENLGSDVFLCCPGPSLSKVNMDKIYGPGRFVVAMNTAYPYVLNPDLWIGMDSLYCYDRSLWSRGFQKIAGTLYQNDVIDDRDIKSFPNLSFLAAHSAPISEIYTHKTQNCEHIWNNNTFESALDILVWMGAKRINLIGCDFGGEASYHDDRKLSKEHEVRNKNTYQYLINRLQIAAMVGMDYGVQFVSCTEDSPANNFIQYMPYEQAVLEAEQKLPKFVDNTVWDTEPAEMMRWSAKPRINQGVLTGCDKNHEWMLPWWFANFRKHNPAIPVCFVDMGMTPSAIEWCKQRGLIFQQFKPSTMFHRRPFALMKTPFEHTIAMDPDCEVLGSMTPLFEYGDALVVTEDPYNPWSKEFRQNPISAGLVAYKHGDWIIDRWTRKLLAGKPDGKEWRGDDEPLNLVITELEADRLAAGDILQPTEFVIAPRKYQRLRLDNCEFPDTVMKHWSGPEGKEIIREKMSGNYGNNLGSVGPSALATDKAVEKEFNAFLKGKKVVLVGPAESIRGTNQGSLIDGFDIIVRLNHSVPVPENLKKDIGTRTDILYNCFSESIFEPNPNVVEPDIWKVEGVKWVASPYPDDLKWSIPLLQTFRKANEQAKLPFHIIDKELYTSVEKGLTCRPNTGFAAIVDLLSKDIACLYITGLTFYKGGYLKEYRPWNEQQAMDWIEDGLNPVTGGYEQPVHKQAPQIEAMRAIRTSDSRVTIDGSLEEVLRAK